MLLAAYPDGVRVDAAVETGSVVGTDYDSMIAKVIAHGPDRATALARLDRALARTAILGLATNVGFLRSLLAREDVRAGELDTGLIGRLDPVDPPLSDEQVARAYAARSLGAAPDDDPFSRRDGWRLGGAARPVLLAARRRRRRTARHHPRPKPARVRRLHRAWTGGSATRGGPGT